MQEEHFKNFYKSLNISNEEKLDELIAIVRHKLYQYLAQLTETIGRNFNISESKLHSIFIEELSFSLTKQISNLFNKQTEIIAENIKLYESPNNRTLAFLNRLEDVTTIPSVKASKLEPVSDEYTHFLRRKLGQFEEINNRFDSHEILSIFKRTFRNIEEEFESILKNHLKSSHKFLEELVQNTKIDVTESLKEDNIELNNKNYPDPSYETKMARLKQMLGTCNMQLLLNGDEVFAKDNESGHIEKIIFHKDNSGSIGYYRLENGNNWEWLGIYIKSQNDISGPHYSHSRSNNNMPIKISFNDYKNTVYIEGILNGEKYYFTFKDLETNNPKHKVCYGEFLVDKSMSFEEAINLLSQIAPNAVNELGLKDNNLTPLDGLPIDVFDLPKDAAPDNLITKENEPANNTNDLLAEINDLENEMAILSAKIEEKRRLLKTQQGIDPNTSFKSLKGMQNEMDEATRNEKLNKGLGDFFL